jgi:hypothetical protein
MTPWHPTFNLRLLLSANWKHQQRHDLTARQDRQEHALRCIEKNPVLGSMVQERGEPRETTRFITGGLDVVPSAQILPSALIL